MGMTDKQFSGYLRLVLDYLTEIQEENDPNRKRDRLQKLIGHIRDTIGD